MTILETCAVFLCIIQVVWLVYTVYRQEDLKKIRDRQDKWIDSEVFTLKGNYKSVSEEKDIWKYLYEAARKDLEEVQKNERV